MAVEALTRIAPCTEKVRVIAYDRWTVQAVCRRGRIEYVVTVQGYWRGAYYEYRLTRAKRRAGRVRIRERLR